MNIRHASKNFIIIAFLLSLLFHASTIFYIFTQKLHTSLITEMENNEQNQQNKKEIEKQSKQTPWVETKARADNFGAPVFF